MATNKRKDAAALFELIDKSSLKVPKNAGSLKIPSWWSSKTNTPPPTAASAAPADAKTVKPSSTPPSPSANGTAPTIRAPGPVAAPKPTPIAAVPAPKPTPKPPESPAKPFAPATANAFERPSGGSFFSEIPLWAIVAGAAFILLIVFLTAFSLMHKSPAPPVTNNNNAGTPPIAQSNGNLSEPSMTHADGPGSDQQLLPPAHNNPTLITGNNDAGPEPSKPGQVYEPSALQRDFNLYYIIVAHSPTESIARRNAKFIADNGVDVALEVTVSKGKTWYLITSAKGYPSMVAAEPDRKKIVAIGHLTQDYKLHHKAWDDAYVNQLQPPAK